MTVNNSSNRTSAVGNNTVGQNVPFSFPIADTSEIVVKTRVTATGVESDPLIETTNYTVAIVGDVGGSITMVTAVAVTAEIHIIRDTDETQETQLTQGGPYSGPVIEAALDKLTKLIIERVDAVTRTLRAPATDAVGVDMEIPNSVDRKGQFSAYTNDVYATPTVVASVAPATATITAFMETLLDDANAAAGRATLDVQQLDAGLTDLAGLSATDSNLIEGDGSNWTAINKSTLFTGLVDEILTFDGAVLAYEGDVITFY